jgi:hypothetical protein
VQVSDIGSLGAASRFSLYALVGLIAFLTLLVAWAQIGCLRGRPFQNPDGTIDDWREQKIFYGMAWADLLVACPLAVMGAVLIFRSLPVGALALTGVSVWMLWANVMTTVTSLRFERPRITVQWLLVFPFGALVGLAYLCWVGIHFGAVFGQPG